MKVAGPRGLSTCTSGMNPTCGELTVKAARSPSVTGVGEPRVHRVEHSGIDDEIVGAGLIDEGDHLEVDREVALSLEGDPQREADIVFIELARGFAARKRHPGNHEPHMATDGDLRLGGRRKTDQCQRSQ